MNKNAAFSADEDRGVNLTAALKWVNAAVTERVGQSLREPEIVILKGTWRGLTYEQMAEGSDYSTNYLMRDVAPKLWKQLSGVFDRSVGKTNFRVALEAYAAANAATDAQLSPSSLAAHESPYERLGERSGERLSERSSEIAGAWSEGEQASALAIGTAYRRGRPLGGSSAPVPMYGYEPELAQAQRWLSEAIEAGEGYSASYSRIVGIWGLRGVGKSLLAEKLVFEVGDRFDFVIWRSLQSRPTLPDLSASILLSLGLESPRAQAPAQLLATMSQRPILLVLEGIEAILQSERLAGDYQPGYQSYGEFFQLAASTRSCVLVTGLEGPADLVRESGYGQAQNIRQITLSRLSQRAAVELLQAESLTAADRWLELIDRYQGHPLALKSAARVIREIFNGRVDEFLKQTSVLFTDILRLLAPSFERLSGPEISILYWLASQEKSLSLSELQQTLPLSLRAAELISALDSLKQRSLLLVYNNAEPPTFYLPSLVKTYALYRFLDQFSESSQTATGAMGQRSAFAHTADSGSQSIINLSPSVSSPVRLSQWSLGYFDADWQSLDRLFETAARPAVRLRSAYHLRDETFIKRCKSIDFGRRAQNLSQNLAQDLDPSRSSAATESAVLLVAIHQDAESLYKICVQAQPAKDASVLPENLELKLLDTQRSVLASVVAGADDTFIQLPYFRGASAESFEIELVLAASHHSETFVI
jgi:hypothetical protein